MTTRVLVVGGGTLASRLTATLRRIALVQVVSLEQIEIKAPEEPLDQMPNVATLRAALRRQEPPSYGPSKKGKGGKLKRWG